MLGAIIGDTVGSRFEWNNNRSKEFELFTDDCFLTDDSIMTLAVADVLINKNIESKKDIIKTFKKWGRKYPNAGYGGMFYKWIFTDMEDSYNSFGNGSAMRISPVGFLADSIDEVKSWSKRITEVTHSHPEGIKGAEVTAMCIYYARKKYDKEFIKEYVSKYYNIDFNYDELKKSYRFNETCQETVPQAIFCFLISNSFEDCIRTCVSIGGDTDTVCAIAGGIAEAYYGIPKEIEENILKFISPNQLEIINEFYERC